MKRIAASLLAISLLATAAPVLADGGDPTTILNQISQQEQTQTQTQTPPPQMPGAGLDAVLIPDRASVEAEVALEAGADLQEQLSTYEATLESAVAQNPSNFDDLTKLGLAYQMDQKQDKARVMFEQALALEPGAGPLYDDLAQSLSAVDPGLKIYVGGKLLVSDVPPTLVGGRTLVPLRAILDRFGAQLSFDGATSTATVQLGPTEISIQKDSQIAKVNGQDVTLDVPATIMNGRFMLPLRFISTNLGKDVGYHPGTGGTAVISIIDK